MAAKSWSLLTPTVDALKNTIAGLIRDVKKHCFTAAGFYAEAQSTPDRTIAIYAGIVYFGITKVEYDGLAVVDLGTGGAFQTTALTANYYNKVLFTIDYAGTLAMTEGTEHAAAASVVAPAIPESKFPACMVTIQDDGTGTAGTILTIEQSEIQQLQRFASVFKDNDLGTPSAAVLTNATGYPNVVDIAGAEQVKVWTYVHTITAAEITATLCNVTITAVTLANIRGLSGNYYAGGRVFMTPMNSTALVPLMEISSTTNWKTVLGGDVTEGSTISIVITEAV